MRGDLHDGAEFEKQKRGRPGVPAFPQAQTLINVLFRIGVHLGALFDHVLGHALRGDVPRPDNIG
jgi:hypothetical protein